jgi:glycosyltransferase involved in cell wall biosynthesis
MISVIIPCYNYGHLIAETIDSVLHQSYTDVEIIVIDDGSTDNTSEVLNEYADKYKQVKYYKYENAGLGTARNRGLGKATGQYIQFLDADDLIEPGKFELQLKLFTEHPEADVVYSSVRYFKNNAFDLSDRLLTYWGPDKEWMPKTSGKADAIYTDTFKGNFAHLSSPLFKKELVDRVGAFDNEISAVADYHFLLRCVIAQAYFYYHDTPGTYSLVRWHPDNMSRNVQMMQTEELKMRKKLAPLLIDHPLAELSNNNAIKSFEYRLNSSWKKHFLSGGKFDFIKKVIRLLGVEKMLLKVFYK